ncbi:ethylbenzene dehydrogenase-related protein [Halomarina litorea]|uniref:ethylbenzene dehydrogenase-related protein n=1 Tax=Halomarina litorea TaxID=2961595 RepID=UPI0020C22365|nr:ethylbenzene dehydrogenase-related protein [Halomarina sp. BCD28]
MDRKPTLLAALLAIGLVVTTLVVPALVSARPAYEIPVANVDNSTTLDTVDGEGWDEAPSAGVSLSSSGAAVPGGDESTIDEVRVASARTDERLYIRLSWADPTRDTSADDVRQFADAVAVQVPVNESARPPIAMGSTDNRVNVWYWNGLNVSQELLAGGPGTTTVLSDSNLESNATYQDGRWHVVLSRPLDDVSDNRTSFSAEQDVDVAVAVWNGSSMERSGAKATSEWHYLALGPGPQGPPYETILWLVAGLGIVFTTLVTIEGVRRTRGE